MERHAAVSNSSHNRQAGASPFMQRKESSFFGPVVQAKFTVNQPGDAFEREADAVADSVMRMPAGSDAMPFFGARPLPLTSVQRECACSHEDKLQRMEAEPEEDMLQMKEAAGYEVQRKCAACEQEEGGISRQETATGVPVVTPSVQQTLASSGQPMDGATRSFMESRFGYDFSGVQIHNDAAASQSSAEINARAYTHGNHIVFGAGQYQPQSSEGKRLLAHELSHTVQQGASPAGVSRKPVSIMTSGGNAAVQREVERGGPKDVGGVKSADFILGRIKDVEGKYLDKGAEAATMARLADLGFNIFNPGAPGAAGPTNAFVYTCKCGWIDMGHFMVSAAVAYMISFLKQGDLRVNGKSHPIEEYLIKGFDKAEPEIEALINTVPGHQGKAINARVRELLKTGDPAAIALAFGYGTEFYQQAVKLIADRIPNPPKALEGEQRSAFTIEDLSSDCYGSYRGGQLWKQISSNSKKLSETPIHDTVKDLFDKCDAKFPQGETLDNMMEETVPGSVNHVAGKDPRGTPQQDQNREAPNQLKSAVPICGMPAVYSCEIGSGADAPAQPLSKVTIDITAKDKSITVIVPAGNSKALAGTSIIKVNVDGELQGVTKLNIPGVGVIDISASSDFNVSDLARGELANVNLNAQAGPLTVDATMKISYHALDRLRNGMFKNEVKRFEEMLKSGKFNEPIYEALEGKIDWDEFKERAKVIIKDAYPEGAKVVIENVLGVFIMDVIAHTKIDINGTGKLWDIPVMGFLAQKRAPVRIAGYDAPVLRYAQWGLLFTQFLKGEVFKQSPLALGYSENWLIGDPRPGGPQLSFGATAGLALPQSELFFDGYGALTTDTGFQVKAGFHFAPYRFGPKETQKPIDLFNTRIPEGFPAGPKWDRDERPGPVNAYLSVGTDKLNVKASYEIGLGGTSEAWLTIGGTHTWFDSKGDGVK